MIPMLRGRACAPLLVLCALAASVPPAHAAAPDSVATRDVIRDSLAIPANPARYAVVVSATRTRMDVAQVPNATAIVTGDELRRRGTRTVAEALQDVVGIDTGEGSDNGPQTPNIGMWGLKEFDALLVTVDGVPVGGPFNPALTMIPVDDIDRIEIVKGPQGTLYGVSAFAGMVQVFTRSAEAGRGSITAGGGSFGEAHGSVSVSQPLAHGWGVRLFGQLQRYDGWQERTGHDVDRGRLGLSGPVGAARLSVTGDVYRDQQHWGSPLPFDASGAVFSGIDFDRNYAVRGAEMKHQFGGANTQLTWPVLPATRFENTFGFTHDRRHELRSFMLVDSIADGAAPSEAIDLHPTETTWYEDARVVQGLRLAGAHELVGGVAVTAGRTQGDGRSFDFDQEFDDPASIPQASDIPDGFPRTFEDERSFTGVYAHDAWTLHPRVTLSGGARIDFVDEDLEVEGGEEAGSDTTGGGRQKKEQSAWSGDGALLVRLLPEAGAGPLELANAYVNWKSSFKPAAPNLSEAEEARILDPERTHSVEAGVKSRALDRQLAFDVSWFEMTFNNLVVSVQGPNGPELVNAGRERFKGVEAALTVAPHVIAGTSLMLGYAHHDARYVQFAFSTPDGVVDVSGHRLELAPRDLLTARLQAVDRHGLGAFATARWQGRRAFDPENTVVLDPFTEWDAGGWWALGGLRISVTGRNLGNDRHVVGESEIGDSEFFIAPPSRMVAEASYSF